MRMKWKTTVGIFIFLATASIPVPASAGVLRSQGNRYVLGQISKARMDQYMLDTKTGRLWELDQSKQGAVLVPIPYLSYKNGRLKSATLKPTNSKYGRGLGTK